MERGAGNLSAVQEIEQRHGIPVISIATLDDLIEWLQKSAEFRQNLGSIAEYRQLYGIVQHA
jgi:orotate phosphoribosyltransferase